MLRYKGVIVIFLKLLLNLKSKHIIKGTIAQVERKQGKITYG